MSAELPVVLVGGWGLPVSLIAPLLEPTGRPVTALALDQVAPGEAPEHWLDRNMAGLPERAEWMGWSLGGQLAMLAADRFPQRIAGVATLCSSPCFVAQADWRPGMAPALFDQFRQGLQSQPLRQWQRFVRLQVHGDRYEREALRQLSPLLKAGPETSVRTLETTLDWLRRLDQRELWRQCPVPRLHLWGGRDQVCLWRGEGDKGLTGRSQGARLADMAHWPGGTHHRELKPILTHWLARRAA